MTAAVVRETIAGVPSSSHRDGRVGNRQRAERARREWRLVAPEWTRRAPEIERQSQPMTDALLAHADIRPGDRVLELAAGPGGLGEILCALVGPRGAVVVTDVSPEMVSAASERMPRLPNLRIEVRDMCAIDEPDASFDVVVCRMGLPFAGDTASALREIRRVLRPGGRFAAVTCGPAEDNPWLTCVIDALATAGVLPPVRDEQPAISRSSVDGLTTLAAACGFVGVCVEAVPLELTASSIDEHFDRITALAAGLQEAIRRAAPAAIESARAVAGTLAAPHAASGGVALPGLALVVAARRATER